MIREIIIPENNTYVLKLPADYVGKPMEIIAFKITEPYSFKENASKEDRLKRIEELTRNSLVDLSHFTFDRDEANNYNE